MQGRAFAIATAVLMFGTSAHADPVPSKKPAQPTSVEAQAEPTVLAAVDPAVIPAALKDAPARPAKKRNARITSCRCGDPSPQR